MSGPKNNWHKQPKCGAKTRSGQPCRGLAMRNGRCRMHGGKTPRGSASPHFKHGYYSKELLIAWPVLEQERRLIQAAYVRLGLMGFQVKNELKRALELSKQKRYEAVDQELLKEMLAELAEIESTVTNANFKQWLAHPDDN